MTSPGPFSTVALATTMFAVALGTTACLADSIFNTEGMGEDLIPVQGPTQALAGAVAAYPDPLAASIINPSAAARAQSLILTGGFVHTRTSTDNLGTTVETVGSSFPSVAAIIPLGKFALLAGLYVEKQGRVSFAETDTLKSSEGTEGGTIYDASFVRETSVYSVPLFVSTEVARRLLLSAGIVFSFFDLREETALDFRASEFIDTDDVADTQAMGEGFAAAFLVDLDRLSLGGLYRNGVGLDGSLDRTNSIIGLWSSEDVEISSHEALRFGLRVRPVSAFSIEADYDRTPWSRLTLDGHELSDRLIERWSVGIQYRGERLWRASKYPLSLGFSRQPADWRGGAKGVLDVGDVSREVYSVGLSIPLAQERAELDVALQIGSRKSEARPDLKDSFYGFSVSISAVEPWTKEMKH